MKNKTAKITEKIIINHKPAAEEAFSYWAWSFQSRVDQKEPTRASQIHIRLSLTPSGDVWPGRADGHDESESKNFSFKKQKLKVAMAEK